MSQPANAHDLPAVFRLFQIQGDFLSGAPYGSGHINDTYAVVASQAGTPVRYILQRVNHDIFKNPAALMENIARVTAHSQSVLADRNDPDASRKALTTVPARDGKPYAFDADGNLWRVYLFIERATGYDIIENTGQAVQAARAFGSFQALVADLPGERLHETIPDFHHTPKRFQALQAAIEADFHNRAAAAAAEIAFACEREGDTGIITGLMEKGEIPERVTHNDTKLNNVLIDDATGEGVCVIDLDTTMPGCALYDFGDMVRTATNSAAEDETDLSRVESRMEMFEALATGYLETASAFLTAAEKRHLAFSGKLLTLECGMRFLTDYLSGDTYFKTKHPEHNIERCRNQFALVRSIESRLEEMQAFVDSL